jgi:hypothetical protein
VYQFSVFPPSAVADNEDEDEPRQYSTVAVVVGAVGDVFRFKVTGVLESLIQLVIVLTASA